MDTIPGTPEAPKASIFTTGCGCLLILFLFIIPVLFLILTVIIWIAVYFMVQFW